MGRRSDKLFGRTRFVSCRPAGSFFRLNGTSKPFGDFQVMAAGTGRGTSRNASRGACGTSSKRASGTATGSIQVRLPRKIRAARSS